MTQSPVDSLGNVCHALGFATKDLGVIIVDHGSRRAESNAALLSVVAMFREDSPYEKVEPAHMELAEPSIETAFDRLIQAGAKFVVVHPYFLLPGRHWAHDIPALAAAAADKHHVGYFVTAPLGIHPLMSRIMHDRIEHCLRHVAGEADVCDLCEAPAGHCRGAATE